MDTSSIFTAGLVCFGGFVVLTVIVAVVGFRGERRRRAALRRWAAEYGWQMVRRPAVNWGLRMPGRNRRGVDLALTGVLGGRPVTIAEYSYTSGSADIDDISTTHRYVLMVVRLRWPGPTVAVFRRGGMSRLVRSLMGDGPTAIGHEPFDRAYKVAANDMRRVRSVLGPNLVAEHAAGRLPDWSLEGTELLAFREGRIGGPAGIPAQFAPLLRVADLIEANLAR
jgi:hypothetical protein